MSLNVCLTTIPILRKITIVKTMIYNHPASNFAFGSLAKGVNVTITAVRMPIKNSVNSSSLLVAGSLNGFTIPTNIKHIRFCKYKIMI